VTRLGVLARPSFDGSRGQNRFDVTVELEQPTTQLRPEMTARADIVVASRGGVLLAPTMAITDDRGTLVARVVGRFGCDVGRRRDRVRLVSRDAGCRARPCRCRAL
jgi:multidrug efflux pump subunit AcrA (membrane-fusion protein)